MPGAFTAPQHVCNVVVSVSTCGTAFSRVWEDLCTCSQAAKEFAFVEVHLQSVYYVLVVGLLPQTGLGDRFG